MLRGGVISIHAPLAGCDLYRSFAISSISNFNPRTPRGVRQSRPKYRYSRRHFNPRTPRGVRPSFSGTRLAKWAFQSTHPSRGATLFILLPCGHCGISIHAPLAGCDRCVFVMNWAFSLFQSTHPLRGATCVHHTSIR